MNASNGKTLIVDGSNPECYPVPSAALRDAGEHDQIEIRPGVYEDKLFVSDRPIRLLGAGRDLVVFVNRDHRGSRNDECRARRRHRAGAG